MIWNFFFKQQLQLITCSHCTVYSCIYSPHKLMYTHCFLFISSLTLFLFWRNWESTHAMWAQWLVAAASFIHKEKKSKKKKEKKKKNESLCCQTRLHRYLLVIYLYIYKHNCRFDSIFTREFSWLEKLSFSRFEVNNKRFSSLFLLLLLLLD